MPIPRYPTDRLVFSPDDVDLSRSPLVGLEAETFVLGAFNPGLTRLSSGNLLMMVRVAQALSTPIMDGKVHAIRWEGREGTAGAYVLDAWPLDMVDTTDPRVFTVRGAGWKVIALTSLSWLLPVEMSPDGLDIVAVHYDHAVAPHGSYQCYGIEDARISRFGERYLMTTCSVSPERHSTTLYTSDDGLVWHFADIVLDHQNKDMLIFEGLIEGHYWAQTRPLGDLYFAYPPGSEWRAGPAINLATSPDALHWKPHRQPGIRSSTSSAATERIGGGTPPILTDAGWLTLWHGVEPGSVVGTYRTFWSLLDRADPSRILYTSPVPVLEASPELTRPIEHQMYLRDIVFTTGIADGDAASHPGAAQSHYIVASGEADLACRITHIPKAAFQRPSSVLCAK